jgi:hypothetical protein
MGQGCRTVLSPLAHYGLRFQASTRKIQAREKTASLSLFCQETFDRPWIGQFGTVNPSEKVNDHFLFIPNPSHALNARIQNQKKNPKKEP